MAEFLYCLNSSTIRPTPILEKIRIAGEVGYAAIELWHDDIEAFQAEGGSLADLRKAISDQGLQVPTTIMVKGWCDTTGEEHAAALEECRQRMAQAVELGAQHVIAAPPRGRVDIELAARNYRELLDVGLSMGIRPAMEYLGFVEQINRTEDALEIMTASEHPGATIVLDPFHNFRGGGSLDVIAQLKPSQIAICHFDDTPAAPPREEQNDSHRVMPGEGHLDLKRYVALLKQIGYNGWLSLELFNPALWARDPEEVARVGLQRMSVIAEAAVERS